MSNHCNLINVRMDHVTFVWYVRYRSAHGNVDSLLVVGVLVDDVRFITVLLETCQR